MIRYSEGILFIIISVVLCCILGASVKICEVFELIVPRYILRSMNVFVKRILSFDPLYQLQ